MRQAHSFNGLEPLRLRPTLDTTRQAFDASTSQPYIHKSVSPATSESPACDDAALLAATARAGAAGEVLGAALHGVVAAGAVFATGAAAVFVGSAADGPSAAGADGPGVPAKAGTSMAPTSINGCGPPCADGPGVPAETSIKG